VCLKAISSLFLGGYLNSSRILGHLHYSCAWERKLGVRGEMTGKSRESRGSFILKPKRS